MAGTYTYEPAMITSYGKDRMRFELGDVMVDGKERTCALSDEEYIVLCDDVQSAKDWKRGCGSDVSLVYSECDGFLSGVSR